MSIYTVLCAGHGGHALAALLKKHGHTRVWNRTPGKLQSICEAGGINGWANGISALLDVLTTNIGDAIKNAKIICCGTRQCHSNIVEVWRPCEKRSNNYLKPR